MSDAPDSGLATALANFRAGLAAGRVAHATLVVGPPREEGTEFARQAIGMLFCGAAETPCGRCAACRSIAARSHADVLWVEPEKKSRMISVEQIRDLQHRVQQTAFGAGWKACVLVSADRLGDSASNAFLKTLEEPPPSTLFLLLTDTPQLLLPTIHSRCQRIVLAGERVTLPAEWCEQVRAIVADPHDGSVVSAFSRADRMEALFKALKEAAEAAVEAEGDAASDAADAETMDARVNARYREMRSGVLQYLLRWYRDQLALRCGGDDGVLIQPGDADILRDRASRLTHRQALRNIEVIESMNRLMEGNVHEGTALVHGFGQLT